MDLHAVWYVSIFRGGLNSVCKIAFSKNANNSVLYSTERLNIGEEYIPDIDIQATPNKRVDSGKKVTLAILGIPIVLSDLEKKSIALQKIDNEVKAENATIGSP